jgi:hypothetical protein
VAAREDGRPQHGRAGRAARGAALLLVGPADWTGLEYVGAGRAAGDPVVRGSLDDGSFSAWGLADDGRVVSCVAVGGGSSDLDEARRLIREHAKADPRALTDQSTDLAGL